MTMFKKFEIKQNKNIKTRKKYEPRNCLQKLTKSFFHLYCLINVICDYRWATNERTAMQDGQQMIFSTINEKHNFNMVCTLLWL